MLKRLRKNHPLLYCIGAEAVFLGSLFVSSYLVVIALLLFRFNFAYADDYLLAAFRSWWASAWRWCCCGARARRNC